MGSKTCYLPKAKSLGEHSNLHIMRNLLEAFLERTNDAHVNFGADPSELQGTIVWMASDASSYLNGSDIVSLSLLYGVPPACTGR